MHTSPSSLETAHGQSWFRRLKGALPAAGVALALVPSQASANHAWSGLHWPSDGRGLALVNQAGPQYADFVGQTVTKWRRALAPYATPSFPQGPLAIRYEADGPPRCERPNKGEILICARYLSGYAGLTKAYADSRGHLLGATVLFDPRVGRDGWMGVLCHEVGHALSLAHRNSRDRSSCMTSPAFKWQSDPDSHDGQQIAINHNHFDPTVRRSSRRVVVRKVGLEDSFRLAPTHADPAHNHSEALLTPSECDRGCRPPQGQVARTLKDILAGHPEGLHVSEARRLLEERLGRELPRSTVKSALVEHTGPEGDFRRLSGVYVLRGPHPNP